MIHRVMEGYQIVKRFFCIVASALGIILSSPLWLIAVIGIKVSDPGPVFYMAERIGKNGRPFRMYKFRSMHVQKGAGEACFKADPNRIFTWGRIMRDLKIDELPQLLNCLIGDMAIIGPRPASKDQVETVRAGRYAVVSSVTPGLSGPSAIYDYIYGETVADEADYHEKVLPTRLELDLFYVRHMSIHYDMKMTWWTILCILFSFSHSKSKVTAKILAELRDSVKEQSIREAAEVA